MLYKWTLTLTLTLSSFFTQQAVVQMELNCAVQVDIDHDIDLVSFFTQQAVVQMELNCAVQVDINTDIDLDTDLVFICLPNRQWCRKSTKYWRGHHSSG